jgi:hypothetical protein
MPSPKSHCHSIKLPALATDVLVNVTACPEQGGVLKLKSAVGN